VVFLRDDAADGTSRRLYRGGDVEGVLGWPAAVLEHHDSLCSFLEPGQPPLAERLRAVLRDGGLSGDFRMRQPDGSWAWMRTQARRLTLRPDGGGEMAGYIVNITAQRAAEARSVAAARLATLGEMATGLAHEMKQPLTAIAMAAGTAQQALARGDLERVAARLGWVVDQAMRAGAMVEHHRRFGRGAEPGAPPGPVGLDTAVEGALALVGRSLDEAGVRVELALGEPPPAVLGHLIPLEQVLVNLLGNARDALAQLPEGTPRQVRIAALPAKAVAEEAGMVGLSVSDTGGGLPPPVIARLFEPFVSTKGPDQGTGLGLSICHGLVTSMGGTMAAANDGTGAAFTLRLPAAPADPVEASVALAAARPRRPVDSLADG
jgi:signal transduction histidine kinase